MKRSFIREILESITPDTISFAGGLPDHTLFPVQQISQSAAGVLTSPSVYQYTTTPGYRELREKIARLYEETFNMPTHPDEILITNGSQQALDLIAKVYLQDGIWVHEPVYLGAIGSFRSNNRPIHSLGEEDDLALCIETRMNEKGSCYLISDFHNPSTKTLTLAERKRCAEQIERKNGLLIEDGAYALLSFNDPIFPMAHFIPERSIHLGSFSKILTPGFRIGWLRAPKALMAPLIIAKESADLHSSTTLQAIINAYWEEFGLKNHIATLKSAYKAKMIYMADALHRHLPGFHFEQPGGGMFIYGSYEHADTFELVHKAMKNGVVFVPGSEFFLQKKKTSYMRLNFTHPTLEQIEEGLKRLALC